MSKNPADKVAKWAIDKLIPYARNSRTHSEAQIAQIAASIKEWGFTSAVLVDPDGGIIAGHGRVMAARKLGMKEVPVMVAEGWTDAQKRAYVIADNKLAMNAGWDDEMLRLELAEIDADGFDLGMTGFDADELAKIMFGEISEPEIPEEQIVPSAYEISVSCDSEAEQERVYEMLTKQGLQCRVLTM